MLVQGTREMSLPPEDVINIRVTGSERTRIAVML
jgi:hypothetical protein